MVAETLYVQCRLRRGRETQVAWLPSERAVPGAFVCLRHQDGWLVTVAYVLAPLPYDFLRGRGHVELASIGAQR